MQSDLLSRLKPMKVKSLGRQIQCIEHTTVTELQQQQINAFKKYIIGDLSEKNASCVVTSVMSFQVA